MLSVTRISKWPYSKNMAFYGHLLHFLKEAIKKLIQTRPADSAKIFSAGLASPGKEAALQPP